MEFQLSYFKSWKMMLLKFCTQYASKFENSSVATRLEKVKINSIPKKGNSKECSNYHIVALFSHDSKLMLKILQVRVQQYMTWELPDILAGFRTGWGATDQLANMCWITKTAREFQKNTYFYFIDSSKAFDYVVHKKLENS